MVKKIKKRFTQPGSIMNPGRGKTERLIALIYNKLRFHEDIEDEIETTFQELFSSDYPGYEFEMEIEEDNGKIYFDGDSFYGHYTQDEFLDLIKNMLSMYRRLVKFNREKSIKEMEKA